MRTSAGRDVLQILWTLTYKCVSISLYVALKLHETSSLNLTELGQIKTKSHLLMMISRDLDGAWRQSYQFCVVFISIGFSASWLWPSFLFLIAFYFLWPFTTVQFAWLSPIRGKLPETGRFSRSPRLSGGDEWYILSLNKRFWCTTFTVDCDINGNLQLEQEKRFRKSWSTNFFPRESATNAHVDLWSGYQHSSRCSHLLLTTHSKVVQCNN